MSERSEYITNMVATYIANEGDTVPDSDERIAEVAARLAESGDLDKLSRFTTRVIQTHRSGFTRDVRNEMSQNDYGRIDWNEVAAQLKLD